MPYFLSRIWTELLQEDSSLPNLLLDMFLPRKKLFSPHSHFIRLDFLHISYLTFQKTAFSPQHGALGRKLPRNFKKGVQLVWRRTFLIYTLTEENSGNDAAFDLAPLDNVPPFSRQVRCLPKDMRKFSGKAEKPENFSCEVTQSSVDINLPSSCLLLLLD